MVAMSTQLYFIKSDNQMLSFYYNENTESSTLQPCQRSGLQRRYIRIRSEHYQTYIRISSEHYQTYFRIGSEHYLCLVPPEPLCCPATPPPEIQPPAVLQLYTSPHLEQHPDWHSTTRTPASISRSVQRLQVESHHLQQQ